MRALTIETTYSTGTADGMLDGGIADLEARERDSADVFWSVLEGERDGIQLSFVDMDGSSRDVTWDDWRRGGYRAAYSLRRAGVQPGDRVGCILTNTFETSAAALGTWLAGGTIISLPTPARGLDLPEYGAQLNRICNEADATIVLVEKMFASILAEHLSPTLRVIPYEDLDGDGSFEPCLPDTDDYAFIQYSSGSTTEPKGCLLTVGAIASQLRRLAGQLKVDGEVDRGVMWLPFSHDMGFFGCVMLSFHSGMRLLVSSPQRFLRSPGSWFGDCHRWGATITAAPNFALEQAVRGAKTGPPGQFPMRKCVLGGERIESSTLLGAARALGPSGLTLDSLIPAYGMAEAVLAVTMTEVGEEPSLVHVDARALAEGELVERSQGVNDPDSTSLVCVGRPLVETAVRIDGDKDVGEICVRTSSLASGYVGNPTATGARFVNGEVRTGDLGFIHQGQLVITGRIDDMMCIGGRNYYARDIEMRLAKHPGIRHGSCVVVTVPDAGRDRVMVMAEPAKDADDPAAVAKDLGRAVAKASGLRVDECLLVTPGTLPKTPSGKIQRFRCRSLIDDKESAVAHVSW